MASLALSLDGELLKEFEIVKPRTSFGRQPYHDIAIDNLAVSGDHAVIVRQGNDLVLEDGGSTNGTLINGARIEKHLLKHGDVIEIGKYHLKFFDGKTAHTPSEHEKTLPISSPANQQLDPARDAATSIDPFPATLSLEVKSHRATPLALPAHAAPPDPAHTYHVALKVLTGKQAGVEIPLAKPLTAIGKKGMQVAIITRRNKGYFLNHVQGSFPPSSMAPPSTTNPARSTHTM